MCQPNAGSDQSYTLLSRQTKSHTHYMETENIAKLKLLAGANAVSLTGDHWASVSNETLGSLHTT